MQCWGHSLPRGLRARMTGFGFHAVRTESRQPCKTPCNRPWPQVSHG